MSSNILLSVAGSLWPPHSSSRNNRLIAHPMELSRLYGGFIFPG